MGRRSFTAEFKHEAVVRRHSCVPARGQAFALSLITLATVVCGRPSA
jgi:hypothetical protein